MSESKLKENRFAVYVDMWTDPSEQFPEFKPQYAPTNRECVVRKVVCPVCEPVKSSHLAGTCPFCNRNRKGKNQSNIFVEVFGDE